MRVDASIRRVQRPAAFRGDIARIMLYMRDTYGFRIIRQDQRQYAACNDAPPCRMRGSEIERHNRIPRVLGKGNGSVEKYRRL